jgi:hypothetical protein
LVCWVKTCLAPSWVGGRWRRCRRFLLEDVVLQPWRTCSLRFCYFCGAWQVVMCVFPFCIFHVGICHLRLFLMWWW